MAETGKKGGWSASGEAGGGSALPESGSRACRRVTLTRRPEKSAWPARGWFSGSGALGKIGDLLQALLVVSEKDVAEKVAGGECFLTTIQPTGKLWGLEKVTGMKHSHRMVSRN